MDLGAYLCIPFCFCTGDRYDHMSIEALEISPHGGLDGRGEVGSTLNSMQELVAGGQEGG